MDIYLARPYYNKRFAKFIKPLTAAKRTAVLNAPIYETLAWATPVQAIRHFIDGLFIEKYGNVPAYEIEFAPTNRVTLLVPDSAALDEIDSEQCLPAHFCLYQLSTKDSLCYNSMRDNYTLNNCAEVIVAKLYTITGFSSNNYQGNIQANSYVY